MWQLLRWVLLLLLLLLKKEPAAVPTWAFGGRVLLVIGVLENTMGPWLEGTFHYQSGSVVVDVLLFQIVIWRNGYYFRKVTTNTRHQGVHNVVTLLLLIIITRRSVVIIRIYRVWPLSLPTF